MSSQYRHGPPEIVIPEWHCHRKRILYGELNGKISHLPSIPGSFAISAHWLPYLACACSREKEPLASLHIVGPSFMVNRAGMNSISR